MSRRLLSRRATLGLVAAVAAISAVAGGSQLLAGPTSTVTTVVFLSQVFPAQTAVSSAGVADDLLTVVRLPEIRRRIAATSGVGISDLRSKLLVAEVGASAAMRFSYTAANATRAGAVATTAAHVALSYLAQTQLQTATDQVTTSQTSASGLAARATKLASGLGVSDVVSGYTALQASIATEKAQALSTTGPALAALGERIATDQARLAKVAAALPDAQETAILITQAQSTLQGATSALVAAQGAVSEASSSSSVTVPSIRPNGRLLSTLRTTIGTFVVLTALLAVALEIRWRRRRSAQRETRTVTDGSSAPARRPVSRSAS